LIDEVDAAFDHRIYRNPASRVKKRLPTAFLGPSSETALQELRAYSTKWAQLVKERNIRIE
jgi:hypothetical protein